MDVITSTFYMDRTDLHLTEKPYELKFPPPEGFPPTNSTWSKHDGIRVTDIRGSEHKYNVLDHGFQITRLKTALAPEDFRDPRQIESVYLKEVAHSLREALSAVRVLVFDYNLRVSVPGFPIADGKLVQYQTPATIVHIDTTDDWTQHMHSLYKDRLEGLELNARHQYVNLWKPIRGPVKRWPLMLCDWKTYDQAEDVIARDLVYTDGQLETFVGMHNASHKYYYISDQQSDEAWVMVQCDSVHGKGVLHTAFPSPLTQDSDPERESIEIRCMAYFETEDIKKS